MFKTDLLVVETEDREFLFTVGYFHPKGFLNCYPQYVPFRRGDHEDFKRRIGDRDYLKATNLLNYISAKAYFKKVMKSGSFKFMDVDPVRGKVFRVPETAVKRIINPREKVESVDSDTLDVIKKLSVLFDVGLGDLGLIGTLAYGGVDHSSDFDIVIYGEDNCRRASSTIKKLRTQKEHQLIKYGRIHHRLFNLNGEIIDPHFVLNPDEQSLLQDYSFAYRGTKRLEDCVEENDHSCFTPAVYQTTTGSLVTYAIGHRMLLDVGIELDLTVKVYEGTNNRTGNSAVFYFWRMEDGWIDPTKDKRFNHRVYDIPKPHLG